MEQAVAGRPASPCNRHAAVSGRPASAAAAITQRDFPEGFVFGAGSSAYEARTAYHVEVAWAVDGKKPSIWDALEHGGESPAPSHPPLTLVSRHSNKHIHILCSRSYAFDHETADVAADQYHKYKEDVKLKHEMGLDAYRFSIAWSGLFLAQESAEVRGSFDFVGVNHYGACMLRQTLPQNFSISDLWEAGELYFDSAYGKYGSIPRDQLKIS
ncbi:hypothetical protein ACP4OV_027723 [Aristida adscensionis]